MGFSVDRLLHPSSQREIRIAENNVDLVIVYQGDFHLFFHQSAIHYLAGGGMVLCNLRAGRAERKSVIVHRALCYGIHFAVQAHQRGDDQLAACQ